MTKYRADGSRGPMKFVEFNPLESGQYAELSQEIVGYAIHWLSVLGLTHHRMGIRWEDSYAAHDVGARVEAAPEYMQFTITVFLPALESVSDVEREEIIVHELLHVLASQVELGQGAEEQMCSTTARHLVNAWRSIEDNLTRLEGNGASFEAALSEVGASMNEDDESRPYKTLDYAELKRVDQEAFDLRDWGTVEQTTRELERRELEGNLNP